MTGIIGKKVGMTRLIQDDGRVIPVTIVECEPNTVTQVKTIDNDGYPALILGFSKLKKPTKTKKFKKIKEFRAQKDIEGYKKDDVITVDILKDVERVAITATSKGKGFQGGIKRWNFSRGPETHGSHHHRKLGSIGACAKPGRVAKGKKMAGRMGNEQVTVKGVKVCLVDSEKNLVCLKGAVPGPNGSTLIIRIK